MRGRLTLHYNTSPNAVLDRLALPADGGAALWREAVDRAVQQLRSLHPTWHFGARPFRDAREGAVVLHLDCTSCVDEPVAHRVAADALRLRRAIYPDVVEYPCVLRALTVPELAMVRRASATTVPDPVTALAALSVVLELAGRLVRHPFLCSVRVVPQTEYPWTQVQGGPPETLRCHQVYCLADLPVWTLIHEVAHVITRIDEAPGRLLGATPVEEHGPEYVAWLRRLMGLVTLEDALEVIEAMCHDGGESGAEAVGGAAGPGDRNRRQQVLPHGWVGMIGDGFASASWCSSEAPDGDPIATRGSSRSSATGWPRGTESPLTIGRSTPPVAAERRAGAPPPPPDIRRPPRPERARTGNSL